MQSSIESPQNKKRYDLPTDAHQEYPGIDIERKKPSAVVEKLGEMALSAANLGIDKIKQTVQSYSHSEEADYTGISEPNMDSQDYDFYQQIAKLESLFTEDPESKEKLKSQSFYFFPGLRTDSEAVESILDKNIDEFGNRNYIDYGNDIDTTQLKQELLEKRQQEGYKPAVIYAHSMGGMVISELLKDKEFSQQFGEIDRLIFDSSPIEEKNVHLRDQMLMKLVHYAVNNENIASKVKHLEKRKLDASDDTDHDPRMVDDKDVRKLKNKTADIPIETTSNLGRFIEQTKFQDNDLKNAKINHINYLASDLDPVIDTDSAHKQLELIFGREIPYIKNFQRPSKTHARGISNPASLKISSQNSQEDFDLAR